MKKIKMLLMAALMIWSHVSQAIQANPDVINRITNQEKILVEYEKMILKYSRSFNYVEALTEYNTLLNAQNLALLSSPPNVAQEADKIELLRKMTTDYKHLAELQANDINLLKKSTS
jgi:hypothetical protein